ncbi:MAG: siphovirus Gp157 family protein [Phycisphaerales bacterium]
MKLYQYPAVFAVIDAALEESEGELTPDLEHLIDEMELGFTDKVGGCAALIRGAKAEADALGTEIDRLTKRKRHALALAERLERYVQVNLEKSGRDRVDAGLFRVRIQENAVPTIRWVSDKPIPDEFARTEVKLDGTKAQQAWKKGVLPDGFEVVLGRHLRIS